MEVLDHRLSGVDFIPTKNFRGTITPKFIVIHYTAGGSAKSSIQAMESRGVSAHLVVDRDGSIFQTVDFNMRAWHAGKSSWQGYRDLNWHSIGIEVCNYGWLHQLGNGKFQRTGRSGTTPVFEADDVIVADHKNGRQRNLGWEIYPAGQLAAVTALCETLLAAYPGIIDIMGHDDIAPTRKSDPGPAMPMQELTLLLDLPRTEQEAETHQVIARSGLNMRAGPGQDYPVLSVLPYQRKIFVAGNQGAWRSVDLENDQAVDGFVHADFIRPI